MERLLIHTLAACASAAAAAALVAAREHDGALLVAVAALTPPVVVTGAIIWRARARWADDALRRAHDELWVVASGVLVLTAVARAVGALR